ncbi:porin [uncultured Tateyamaria sp.]|uniref:porin n=1 Tax=uncultured Tateyamaria sp. TaxID=455651 RepID=UPI00261D304C|nr:porin [uncultured Tateyamaria sp.]
MSALVAMPACAQSVGQWDTYGQINLGALSVADGASTDAFLGENSNVPGRIGVWFRTPVDAGAQLSFNLEAGFGMTGSSGFSKHDKSLDVEISRRALRKFEMIVDMPAAGRLSLGQGSMASDGSAGADLSGTGLAHQVAVADTGGGTALLRTNGTPSGTTIDDAFSALDGLRRFRVRYDSPILNGFQASAAYGQEVLRRGNDNDYYDVAFSYSGDTEPFTAEAKLTYEWVGSIEENLVFSAAVLHKPTGLNAAFATGREQIGPGRYAYLKLGIIRDIFAVGSTAVSVDYYDGRNIAFVGSASKAMSIGVVQKIDPWNMDLFLAHRTFALAGDAENFQDIDATLLGARWRF